MFTLITSTNNVKDIIRKEEILFCLNKNCSNKFIKNVIILCEDKISKKNKFDELEKDNGKYEEIDLIAQMKEIKNAKIEFVDSRPTYKSVFEYGNQYLKNEKVVFANIDIYFSETKGLNLLESIDLEGIFIVLTRYNQIKQISYYLEKYPNTNGLLINHNNQTLRTQHITGSSIDTWIFKPPINIENGNFDIHIGKATCDGFMNYELSKLGKVYNPCIDIVSIHNHNNWSPDNYKYVVHNGKRIKREEYNKEMEKKGFRRNNIPFCKISYVKNTKFQRMHRMRCTLFASAKSACWPTFVQLKNFVFICFTFWTFALSFWRTVMRVLALKYQDVKNVYFLQYFPPKPKVINLAANDICNSRCKMCNIWKLKKGPQISPGELHNILQDDLFTEIRHVGVSGGEPTLRKDLPGLFEVICKDLPSLRGLSIISNAINEKDVIDEVTKVYNICLKYGKKFSILISLDGVGEVHDKIRGHKGNFESAFAVIKHFKNNTSIPVSIGCTISKDNVWELDNILDFIKENNIYGRFRVAEFINRLYNDDKNETIRNFDEEEVFHLACFFKKLELKYETNPNIKRTYRSIANILTRGRRTTGCPYQTSGIMLASNANIQYCSPKSKIIGNSLKQPAKSIYKNNLKERRRILKEHCSNCIHDYHAPITYKESISEIRSNFFRKLFSIEQINKAFLLSLCLRLGKRSKSKNKKIFITGWYGTETVGDKAILGHILAYYTEKYKNVDFFISSLYPFVTVKTLKELGKKATIIPCYNSDFASYCVSADEVVMGGGPLMDMKVLALPLWAFTLARMFKKKTVVFGCGLGPLEETIYINTVKRILMLADEIKLRDSNSVEFAKILTGRTDIINSCDGAFLYVSKLKKKIKVGQKGNTVACFLREWETHYSGTLDKESFIKLRDKFEHNLALLVKNVSIKHNLIPEFYPMHTFVVGFDDRDFYRRFLKEHFKGTDYYFHKYNTSVKSIIDVMSRSKMNLCMRFHSVLFSYALDTKFYAIDYTNGGKITGFLKDNNALNRMITLIKFTSLSPKELNNLSEQIID